MENPADAQALPPVTLAVLDEIRGAQRAEAADWPDRFGPRIRLVVETKRPIEAAELAILCQNLLRVELTVAPMFEAAADQPALDRFYLLTIPGTTVRRLSTSIFDLPYGLQDALELRSVEPEIETDVYSGQDPGEGPERSLESADLLGCWAEGQPSGDKLWALKSLRLMEA